MASPLSQTLESGPLGDEMIGAWGSWAEPIKRVSGVLELWGLRGSTASGLTLLFIHSLIRLHIAINFAYITLLGMTFVADTPQVWKMTTSLMYLPPVVNVMCGVKEKYELISKYKGHLLLALPRAPSYGGGGVGLSDCCPAESPDLCIHLLLW